MKQSFLLLLPLALLALACSPKAAQPGPGSPETSGPSVQPANKVWKLSAYGPADALTMIQGDADISLEMDLVNDRVSGKSGCNRFTGMMQKSDQPYRIGAIAGTKMACLEEKMKMEDLFLGMLQKVTGYSFRSGNLIMDVEDGRQLVFRAD